MTKVKYFRKTRQRRNFGKTYKMISQKLKAIYAQASRWAFPFLLIVLICFTWNTCRKRVELNNLQADFDARGAQMVEIINEKNQVIAESEQLEAKSSDDVKALTDSIFALKKREARKVKEVDNYARIVQEYRRGSVVAGWTNTGHVPDTNVGDIDIPRKRDMPIFGTSITAAGSPGDTGFIRVPKPFAFQDSALSLFGYVTRAGVEVDTVVMRNTLHLVTAQVKSGLFGRKVTTVMALNTNPYVKTTGLASVQVKHEANWWQRWGKPAAGLVLGIVGTYYITR